MDQLTQIMKVTGTPGPEFIEKLESPEVRHFQCNQRLYIQYVVCLDLD